MGLGNFGALGAVVPKRVDQDYKQGLVDAFLNQYLKIRDVKDGTPL
jgi:hypothetical protein